MTYFCPAFVQFFKNLALNNTTQWFNDHRKEYDQEVKKPFTSLVEEMIRRIQKYDPEVAIKPADAITRINKDVRFSKDKSLYHTHVAANISPFGKKDKSYPGFYFQLSPAGVAIYGGAYMVEKDTLQKMRSYIAGHLKQFAGVYSDPAFQEKFGTLQGEKNVRIPPEFQAAAVKEPLLANKQYFYTATLPADLITAPQLPDVLLEYYLAGKKVNDFLKLSIKS